MARINVEDSLFKDIRFFELAEKLGGIEPALGALVRAWMIAQRFYLTPEKTIPIKEWEKQKLNNAIIEVGLATKEGDFVRMAGIDEQFSWLRQRSEAGRHNRKQTERSLTADVGTNRETSSYSISSSSSISKSKKNIRLKASTDCVSRAHNLFCDKMAITAFETKTGVPGQNKASRLMAAYINAYKARYNSRPACVDDRKTWGRVAQFVKTRSVETCEHLVQVYLQLDDPWFNLKFHDLETFFQNVNKVSTALQNGKDLSKPKTTAEILAEMDMAEGK